MSKKLVAYFSATGVTKRAAEALASASGADLYEIKPRVPYSQADLNWHDRSSRSSVEMKDLNSRPALADSKANVAAYDVVFLGFPIWWYTAPTIISTFLEAYDFSGKIIVPFATSGGTSFTKASVLRAIAKNATVKEGRMLNTTPSSAELKKWADSFDK